MNVIKAKSACYTETGAISCLVLFEEYDNYLPFLATSDDVEPHGREIFARCAAGEFGRVKQYVAPTRDYVALAEQKREQLLSTVSARTRMWQTQLLLNMITESDKAQLEVWMRYAQQLQALDLSAPQAIQWPEPPQ